MPPEVIRWLMEQLKTEQDLGREVLQKFNAMPRPKKVDKRIVYYRRRLVPLSQAVEALNKLLEVS
jgi:hypothetical protein